MTDDVRVAVGTLILVATLGCTPSNQPAPQTANAPAPPPPPPPATAGSNTASSTPSSNSSVSAAKPLPAPISELNAYWGKNIIVMVFAPSRDSASYQKAHSDWQAHPTDSAGQPIVWVEVIGTPSALAGQIANGPSLGGQSASDLWDVYGASPTVTAAYVVGKDGRLILDKRRGGELGLAQVLETL